MSLMEKATIARYTTRCDLCGERIIRDCDPIVMVDGVAVHAECCEDQELVPDARPDRTTWEKPSWWEN